MLRNVKTALLLTNIDSFASNIRSIAEECDVALTVEEDWSEKYRVLEEVILCGSKYLDKINVQFYPVVTLILKESESPVDFIKKGITRFIFNHTDEREIIMSFMKESSYEGDTLKDATCTVYCRGEYNFDFEKKIFFWKDKQIYLSDLNQKYLANWLLKGNKENSKRNSLFNIRKRLGKDFLKDVDRFGDLKGE